MKNGKNRFNYERTVLPVRQILRISGIVLVIGIGFIIWYKIHAPGFLPFKTVRIMGQWQHVDAKKLATIIKSYAQQGFFEIDIEQLQARIEQMPWIKSVAIKRIWPHTLRVNIIEHKALAQWNQTALLDEQGELFTPNIKTFPKHLLHIFAPAGSTKDVVTLLREINKTLQQSAVGLTQLTISKRFAVRLTLANGLVIHLGNHQVIQRLNHLIKLYPEVIASHVGTINYVDMRYPNGIAINWKQRVN